MKTSDGQPAARLFPIDVLKALSITAVVSFHSIFLFPSTYAPVAYQLEILFAPLRFCVPVLLTISFFLLKRNLENSSQTVYQILKKRLVRLLIPTVFWFGIAVVINELLWYRTKEQIFIYIRQGTIFPGAYYLLVLFQLFPIFILLHPWFNHRRNLLLTFLFQAIAFLLIYTALVGSLSNLFPLVLRDIHRSLFIYWFVYTAIGAYLYKNWSAIVKLSQRIPISFKILLLFLLSLVMVNECRSLYLLTGKQIEPFEYVMFSCIISVLAFFLCFASVEESQISVPVKKAIKLLSTYSLGIFCINGIIDITLIPIIDPILKEANLNLPKMLAMKLLGWIILLALSLWLSRRIDKLGFGVLVR